MHSGEGRIVMRPYTHGGKLGFVERKPSPGGTPQGGFSCPFGQFTSRCPSAHTGADEGGACRNLCVFMKTRTLRPHFPHQSRLRRASFPQGKPFTNPNLQPLRNHLVGRGLAPADSRCGCSRRGHKPLRLRANPARPLAVPGLCPSAPGLMPLLATPPRYRQTPIYRYLHKIPKQAQQLNCCA